MKAYYQARSNQLSIEVDELLLHIKHDGLRGRHAEDLLKKYLESVLPERYGVDTGLVTGINSDNHFITSSEVDIIIYDKIQNPALQTYGSFKIFPAEAVSAVIAVKITATTGTILTNRYNTFENIKSIKKVPRGKFSPKIILPGVGGNSKPDDIIYGVFAFRSMTKLEKLAENINNIYLNNDKSFNDFPDIICVMDIGNIIINPSKHGFKVNNQVVKDPFFIPKNEALMIFTCSLVSMLNAQALMPVDLFEYAYALKD